MTYVVDDCHWAFALGQAADLVRAQGSLKFLVKWEGWEKKADMTWEPEDNLL